MVPEQKTFRQIRNDEKDIQAIADGYKTKIMHELWLPDGLQKDAIQNSWDAKIDKKRGKGWECGLSLVNAGSNFSKQTASGYNCLLPFLNNLEQPICLLG